MKIGQNCKKFCGKHELNEKSNIKKGTLIPLLLVLNLMRWSLSFVSKMGLIHHSSVFILQLLFSLIQHFGTNEMYLHSYIIENGREGIEKC